MRRQKRFFTTEVTENTERKKRGWQGATGHRKGGDCTKGNKEKKGAALLDRAFGRLGDPSLPFVEL